VKRRVLLLAAVVALIAVAFFGGYEVGAPTASSAHHAYTLRVGDLVTVPAIKQECDVEHEHGIDTLSGPLHPLLVCGLFRGFHHQVDFYRNKILVRESYKPDPVWSGKP
jgi:hypothetical protein